MRYNAEQLDELANKIDLVDLIGQSETLYKQGQNYFISCPFHDNDDTPSLCINPVTNKWHCFGCGKGSSVYDWVMLKEKKSFPEALEYICSLVGEEPTNYIESESISFLKKVKKLKDNATKDSSENIRKILDFTEDYLNKYTDELPQEWLDEGMTEEALKTYNIRIDHNANRIVYPVFDAEDNFIGVKGRTRIAAYKELGLSKYMNYNKIGVLDFFQGYQQAEFNNSRSIILFEGIKSCIKAYGWGIKNTVACETSKLSDGQVQLLIKNGFSEVVIGFDSDQDFKSIVSDSKIQILKRFCKVSVIRDKHGWLGEKMAPVDRGENVFRKLIKERVTI